TNAVTSARLATETNDITPLLCDRRAPSEKWAKPLVTHRLQCRFPRIVSSDVAKYIATQVI
ncbi:hypothetical protein, partial [Mycobacterium marinum]|uniref:hypothetical protein n=1 Tax=Mycobacterium marinum TaxID=1781 RepID=UPI003561FA53